METQMLYKRIIEIKNQLDQLVEINKTIMNLLIQINNKKDTQ